MQKTLVEIIDIPLLLISASIYIAFQMYTTNYDYSVSDLILLYFIFSRMVYSWINSSLC